MAVRSTSIKLSDVYTHNRTLVSTGCIAGDTNLHYRANTAILLSNMWKNETPVQVSVALAWPTGYLMSHGITVEQAGDGTLEIRIR
jgi:hypothetical protein